MKSGFSFLSAERKKMGTLWFRKLVEETMRQAHAGARVTIYERSAPRRMESTGCCPLDQGYGRLRGAGYPLTGRRCLL